MRTMLLAVVLGVTLAGCVVEAPKQVEMTPEARQAAQQEAKVALEEQVHCLSRYTAELDDGISSAEVIGRYVGQSCHAAIMKAQYALFASMEFVGKLVTPSYLLEHENEIVRDTAARAVLSHRQEMRESGQSSPSATLVH
jgi:hypothetical protein